MAGSTTSPAAAKVSASAGIPYDGGLTASMQVTDIKKSIAWYEGVMGFKLVYHVEDMGWCELSTGVNRVNVGLSQVEKPNIGLCSKLTWGVTNIDAARKYLEGKKVRFDGPTIELPGMVKLATFFDPDGNPMMFYQDLQGAPNA
jgi:catechol 2,3-dioxygenase-like lactoylglutathione lyase family enzyme